MSSHRKLCHCVREVVDEYFDTLKSHQEGDLSTIIKHSVEKELYNYVLKRCDGNQSKAASILGISRLTLRKHLRDKSPRS